MKFVNTTKMVYNININKTNILRGKGDIIGIEYDRLLTGTFVVISF